jgi:hypothetical protein
LHDDPELQNCMRRWVDTSQHDPGVELVELLTYVADRLSYYQDKAANEASRARRRGVFGVLAVAAVAYWCCGRRRLT